MKPNETPTPATSPAVKFDISTLLDEGKVILLGEWRGAMPETIKYVAKDGKPASFSRMNHVVEVGNQQRIEALKVSVAVPEGTSPDAVPIPFRRGSRVVVVVDSLTIEKGNKSVRAADIIAV